MIFDPNEIEQYRTKLGTQAQQRHASLVAQRQQIDDELAKTEATLARLEAPFEGRDQCPICFFVYGQLSLIRPIGAAPERPNIDLFRCSREHTFENGTL